MDNKRFEEKLDKIVDDISDIKQTMATNTASLETHIRRTDLAEERMDGMDNKITPLEKHVAFMKGAAWALGIVGAMLIGLHQFGILQRLF